MGRKTLHFDCFSGISGDMVLGGLMNLGVSSNVLNDELKKLMLDGVLVEARMVTKNGLQACKADVKITAEDRPHRGLKEIRDIIENSHLTPGVIRTAMHIFTRLAEAEAKVHGTTVDQIHFHEVGALDAIVDIVGTAILLDRLAIDEVTASPVNVGQGMIRCAHGLIPVPAPATVELLKGGLLYQNDIIGELATPTGAAIISALATSWGPMPKMRTEKIGYGAGTKDLPVANVLRILYGERTDIGMDRLEQWMLEVNLDDMNPEYTSYIMDALFKAGAKDVFYTPIVMKKNRPAIKLSVLYDRMIEEVLLSIVFQESTAIGVRMYPVKKLALHREMREVLIKGSQVRVKCAYHEGELVNVMPEYEDCKRVAQIEQIPLKVVYQRVLQQFYSKG